MKTIKKAFFFLFIFYSVCVSAQTGIRVDSLPESQINIPIQIALKPFYALAEKMVDTVFTSPNYPTDWIQSDCATRYKYRFRRSPLKLAANGNKIDISFTGLYQIIGSTRVCVGGAVISPWTPGCGCGFKEGERKVTVGFTSTLKLQPNYILNTKIIRHEPKALDKCEVCFWGQDITTTVISGLKKELDLSKKAMEDSFSAINLRPYMQQAWNKLAEVYSIPGVGYLSLNPKKLRMENLVLKNDLLNISIGISATPVISFEKPVAVSSEVPTLSPATKEDGFSIFLEAALQYDSLSNVLNGYLAGKRFELSEGLIKKHMIIEKTTVSGDTTGNLLIRVDFGGSFNGTAYFTGKPVYNAEKKTIEVESLDYDIKTKNLFPENG